MKKTTVAATESAPNKIIYPSDKWTVLTVFLGMSAVLLFFGHLKLTEFDDQKDQMRFFIPPPLRLLMVISLFASAFFSFFKYHHSSKEQNLNNFEI